MGTTAVLILLACLTAVQGWLFPTVCVKQWNGTRIRCCPSFNGSDCGSKDNRGSCMMLPSSRAALPPDVRMDERYNLAEFVFSAICQCKPTFLGPACGECAFGLTGDRCDKPNIVYRRDIISLTKAQFITFLAELHYCKYKLDLEYSILSSVDRFRRTSYEFRSVSFYDHMCFIHAYITAPFINGTRERSWINFGHESTGFLTWHRLYLMQFERQLQKCLNNPSWGLIYYSWEYEDPTECIFCRNDYFGATDHQGRIDPGSVLSHWRMVCGGLNYPDSICVMSDCECERDKFIRQVGLTGFIKSTYTDVEACMNLPIDTPEYNSASVNSARNCFEGFWSPGYGYGVTMHNAYHMFIAGTMALVPVACNDPLFYVHHANIDKFMEAYIVRNKITPADYPSDNYVYGHSGSSCIPPFLNCWRHRSMLTSINYYNIFYV
ncbi:tyrosinase-like [Hyperolius riggenbachi]|uniref:tyrosinase-like n=1 Tax=Hyperolius riggenbachi TaxID=752182 RepID=UPI0035A34CF2